MEHSTNELLGKILEEVSALRAEVTAYRSIRFLLEKNVERKLKDLTARAKKGWKKQKELLLKLADYISEKHGAENVKALVRCLQKDEMATWFNGGYAKNGYKDNLVRLSSNWYDYNDDTPDGMENTYDSFCEEVWWSDLELTYAATREAKKTGMYKHGQEIHSKKHQETR